MGFTVENKVSNSQYAIVKFVFTEPFNDEDMGKVLTILTNLLDLKKPFAFYVDAQSASTPPLNASSNLLRWMRSNKSRFPGQLICSAVVFENTISNQIARKLINGVFIIQPPVSPNKLTTNLELAERWIQEKVKKFFDR